MEGRTSPRRGGWAALHADIQGAGDTAALHRIHLAAVAIARRAAARLRTAAELGSLFRRLARFHDAITARVLALTAADLAAGGFGPPPLPFCWLFLGSAARREQTVRVDQDNALIYAEPADHHEAERAAAYFAAFAAGANERLAEAGYPLCPGNVMASNPRWRGPWSHFHQQFEEWLHRGDLDALRFLLIAADMRPGPGDAALGAPWTAWIHQRLTKDPAFLERAAGHGLAHRVPLGLFGHFLLERQGEHCGALHLKEGAYFPFVHSLRVLALCAGVKETATFERIDALCRLGVLPPAAAERYRTCFAHLLRLRLGRHVRDGESPDYLRPRELGGADRAALRASCQAARRLQRLAGRSARRKRAAARATLTERLVYLLRGG
ncbi:MAG TPA: DUF294 nucleotidyltransferase-like domain-containing protein [Limnochordia bacterium]